MGCSSSKTARNSNESLAKASKVTSSIPTSNGGATHEDDFIEAVVCQEADIGENQMKQVELGEGKVLLVRQNGKLSAIGSKCSHYGAMLVTGALGEGRVRCPWHGACFNVETGDIEDFPGMDSLPCYRVTVGDAGEVKVRAKRSELATNKRTRLMAKREAQDERTYVVIGGGPSGATCAETLRQEGFTGRVVLINKEPCLPYDRVKVSKTMDMNLEKCLLRTQQFYDDNEIEVMLGTEVTQLDGAGREITLDNGYKIRFDKAYIATGSKPRRPPIDGASDLRNVCVLRTAEDAKQVNAQLSPDKKVVILGTSFIGLEAAAYCVNKVAKVTVIGRGAIPLKESFGDAIGKRVMELFQEKGVEFVTHSGIKRCIGEAGTVKQVELTDGTLLDADICIFGIGSTLYTEFLENSGITVNRNGSVNTDQYLETNLAGVYVGGDIANAPVHSNEGAPATIGHYPLAQYHGRIAALNMLGKSTPLKAVPFFWTVLFGKSFRYCGYGTPEEVIIDGDLQALKFVAFYIGKAGRVIGMSSCQRDPVVAQFAEYSSQGKVLHKSDLSPNPLAWLPAQS
uniref:Rieske domain-containing protein n=1 Tax=Anopheles atroparvus TaxID=41427 RepID=A0AAG5CW51_ANOAO